MRILDRYILKSFVLNYLLALGVMIGMYTLLDLIVNFQNFTRGASVSGVEVADPSAVGILGDIIDFYSYQVLVIFQQVSAAIPLLAAGFTMVRMTRHHELTAMLASGVSLYRVAAPIVLVSMGFSVLHVLNQEFLISQPYVIEKLLRKHDEVNRSVTRTDAIKFVRFSDNSLLSADKYDPAAKQMTGVVIFERDKETSMLTRHIVAETATWEMRKDEPREAWIMTNVIMEDDGPKADIKQHDARKVPMVAYDSEMTPAQLDLIFQKKAVDYLSSSQVRRLAEFSPDINKPLLYKIMHLRVTQPLMNIIMLLIGIPFLLTREPNRLIVNILYCFAVTGVVFVATFVLFQMGGTQLDPLLAAWLPVLVFGPLALVMLDFIQT